jgi:hypothetical protein
LIFISGGIAALDTLHATIGPGRRLDADPGETEADFAERALDEALLIGASFVVVSRPGE